MFKDKKFLKEIAIILVVGIIVNAFCFLMPLVVHAENSIQRLPYDYSWNYYPISQENIDRMLNYASPYVDITSDNLIVFWAEIGDNTWLYTYCVAVVDDVTLSPGYTYDSIDLTQETVYFHFSQSYIGQTQLTSNGLWLDSDQNYAPSGYTFFGTNATIVHPIDYPYDYTFRNMPLYGHVVLNGKTYVGSNNISVGDFTDLPGIDEILNNIQNTWEPPSNITGHALPNQPTENPNNNDFQNRLQMFDYLKDSINSIVGNLGYNLKKWFDNLTGKVVEGFNSVSQNIWNGFKTLMDNIKDFFGAKIDAIIEKFNYITEPLNIQELSDNLNNCNFSSDFLSLTTTISSFGTAFTSGTEPNSCSFTLDFSNSYYNFGVCHFSLDWILPFRSVIRLIVGCLCVYSLIVSIFTSLNTYIGGTSSINDDI